MNIKKLAEKYEGYILEFRRDFHQNPEPAWEEFRTSDIVEEELKKLGIETQRIEGKPGVLGILKGGKPGEKTVALRGDMDALSIKENTDLPFKSTNGYMHACGHDCHTAMLLGAAKILSEVKDEIKGTVKFIFQPAEEIGAGAKVMIEELNVLENVDAIFGMHVWGSLEAGKINIQKGPIMASADIFKVNIKGKASHGSAPHLGIDAIAASSATVMNLQSIVSRNTNPLEPVVISVGKIKGGDNFNIIANEVNMEGTTRAFNPEVRNSLENKMRSIIEDTAETYGAEGSLEYIYCPAPVINEENLTYKVIDSAKKIYKEEDIVRMDKILGAEDFAFYGEKVPAAFAFVGCANEKLGVYPNHNDKFMVDETILENGSALYAQFALDFLD